jgi:hypothetical protein
MRLYHLALLICLAALFSFISAGCSAPVATQPAISVSIRADGQSVSVELLPGSSVEQALKEANLIMNELDKVDPPLYSLVNDGDHIEVTRVTEEFEVEQETIPFEQLRQPTEFLPEGQLQLDPIQKGEPGVREITYQILYENGKEVSRKQVKSTVIKEPVSQVVLVGVLPLISHFAIPGKLAYLSNGEAWLIEGRTDNRRVVISGGELDGRVFSLSSDGNWLLYTRRTEEPKQINNLWVADISAEPIKEIDLGVQNVIHFADWVPGSNSKIVFSTVEPRSTAPGWQANNDLYALSFSPSGWISKWKEKPVLESNSGGVYGWWGMSFSWSPAGDLLAYTRPDGIGLIGYEDGVMTSTLEIIPLQTGEDWAWVPGLSWGADGNYLYTVNHIPEEGSASAEESQVFDLAAVPVHQGQYIRMVPQTGMFGYPVTSPSQPGVDGENNYLIAYLQAVFPTQSKTSPYRLVVMDRDGSNQRMLFPPDGEPGLDPQQIVWSPGPLEEQGNYNLAVINQGNLWLVDVVSGEAHQITGDGLTGKISWK